MNEKEKSSQEVERQEVISEDCEQDKKMNVSPPTFRGGIRL